MFLDFAKTKNFFRFSFVWIFCFSPFFVFATWKIFAFRRFSFSKKSKFYVFAVFQFRENFVKWKTFFWKKFFVRPLVLLYIKTIFLTQMNLYGTSRVNFSDNLLSVTTWWNAAVFSFSKKRSGIQMPPLNIHMKLTYSRVFFKSR